MRGRDVGSFVADAEAALAQVKIWATGRVGAALSRICNQPRSVLQIVVPVCRCCWSFLLLFAMFGKRQRTACWSLLAFRSPLTGGIFGAVAARHSSVDFRCRGLHRAVGVAVLNGLVMISTIRSLREDGTPLDEAIREGA